MISSWLWPTYNLFCTWHVMCTNWKYTPFSYSLCQLMKQVPTWLILSMCPWMLAKYFQCVHIIVTKKRKSVYKGQLYWMTYFVTGKGSSIVCVRMTVLNSTNLPLPPPLLSLSLVYPLFIDLHLEVTVIMCSGFWHTIPIVCSSETEITAMSCQVRERTEELKQLLALLTKFIESIHVSSLYSNWACSGRGP